MMSSPVQKLEPHEFPPLLNEINDPPKRLFLHGTLPNDNNKILCVVGSRKCTDYGKNACFELIQGLRGSNITIISGLALGIDTIAHKAALEAGLQTVAVPGSGLDRSVLYPRSNHQLATKIIESGGGLLSEYEPAFRATTWSFPRRNRIMAGMSHAVLVVEAEQKSGTLITSRLATDYNRDVLTIPGSIFSKTSAGPHMLIRLGATPITSSEDLLEALGFDNRELDLKQNKTFEDCSPAEKQIIDLLHTPRSRDELMLDLDLTTQEANTTLSLLEIKGIIKERMGKIYLM